MYFKRIFLLLSCVFSIDLASAGKWSIPTTDEGLPGEGPIRRFQWFQNLWEKKRSGWSKQVQQDQGALVFLGSAGQVLNIYAQVGLVMLIGLAAGNAILIVDLANQKMREGESALEAAKFSAKSRLRPILMTAISSLTGFLPLMLASGAGAQSQSSLGLVVFGGLLVATFLSTLVVPVFYVVMKTLIGDFKSKTGEGTSGVMS